MVYCCGRARGIGGEERIAQREGRETPKRVSLSVLPSLYEDIQKITYVQRWSTSDLVAALLEQYRGEHGAELIEYERIIIERC